MADVKLDDIIYSLLNEMDRSVHSFVRLFDIGIDALKILNLNVKGRIRTVELDVLPNGLVPFPKDMIEYIKMGVVNDDGEIATFTENRDLSLGGKIPATMINRADYYDYNNDLGGYDVFFGYGSNHNIGEFRVDPTNKAVMIPSGNKYKKIVVEYLSNKIDDSGDYWVDERLEEAVKAFVYWTAIKRRTGTQLYEKRDAEAQWKKQRRLAKAMIRPFRISEANEISRKSVKLALKH